MKIEKIKRPNGKIKKKKSNGLKCIIKKDKIIRKIIRGPKCRIWKYLWVICVVQQENKQEDLFYGPFPNICDVSVF